MSSLADGFETIDLEFLGHREVIATALLHGPAGVALIDPGPATTWAGLMEKLKARGIAPADVRAVLITHIHLDHAGAAGLASEVLPNATFFVHERGAAHMADPSKLIASASRLYGADMDRLWGEMRPLPASRMRVLQGGEKIDAAGRAIDVAYTPGHASHHVSYFDPRHGVAFVGDTAGIRRGLNPYVMPPTPPPDIDLDAWRESTRTILAWHPSQLFLTHFGPFHDAESHFARLWDRTEDWSRRVRASLGKPGQDAELASAFTQEIIDDLRTVMSASEAGGYANAARFDFSWAGLARYWRKRH
ncbi:MAG: MBL fold metallo-hydrolase [Acidobacteriota bacterium]|nr:MBL fold metallo-hydrolase [Acidobacteriota bacterium]